MRTKSLKLEDIRLDGDTQPRTEIDYAVVAEYAELFASGATLPPVVVFHDGASYWLADGFHRWFGARDAKLTKLPCELHTGSLDDARWYSYAANQKHGVRRTNADKAKAVRSALRHPYGPKKSDTQIAEYVGVAVNTVCKYRKEMETSMQIAEMSTRTVRRGNQVYEQNTAKIGRSATKTPSCEMIESKGTRPSVIDQHDAEETKEEDADGVGPDDGFVRRIKIAASEAAIVLGKTVTVGILRDIADDLESEE